VVGVPVPSVQVEPVLPTITALTYLTPLREGGSLPAIMEADDLGTYVVKFVGAGQGPKALISEIVVGELARALGIRTPGLALIEVDGELGRSEPDFEVQDLVLASAGTNLAVDYLPGAVGFDSRFPVEAEVAAAIVWLDALTANVDRSRRNTNLLVWHGDLWAIDHGACLRFHHAWGDPDRFARAAYRYDDHVLAGTGDPRTVHDRLAPQVTADLLDSIVALIPDRWLHPDSDRPDPAAPPDPPTARAAYRDYLLGRLDRSEEWLR
jgi:hypothetical protein